MASRLPENNSRPLPRPTSRSGRKPNGSGVVFGQRATTRETLDGFGFCAWDFEFPDWIMNYFAHGRDYLHRPYFLAGTALPDWLSVLDRRLRVRRRHAEAYLAHPDSRQAEIAAGVVQHLHDDRWFHQTRAFAELSLQLSVEIRQVLPDDSGFRPSFLGHILVEILLDAVLIEQQPEKLDAYYASLEGIDPYLIGSAVSGMVNRSSNSLPVFIPRFLAERFLYDYLDDAKLLWRLNLVMRRVKLAALPPSFLEVLPEARRKIRLRRDELLSPGPDASHQSDSPGGSVS
jgi:hypothetical protein